MEDDGVWDCLRVAFQYLKEAYKKAEEGPFTWHVKCVCSDRTRVSGLNLKDGNLYIRKTFFTIRAVRHWNRLARGHGLPIPGDVQGQAEWGSE